MASVISPGLAPAQAAAVEGIARIVRVEPGRLWLEPEQTTSCGHCASNASCSMSESREAPGMGTVASRLVARRFSLPEREAGGLACAVEVKCCFSMASNSCSVPPWNTLVTKAPPGAST